MDKVSEKSGKIPLMLIYAYIMLPFLIFSIGWMGKRFWIPIVALLAICYWKMCKDSSSVWIPKWNQDTIVKGVFIIAAICVWVYLSGVGKYVFQNTDHNCRNAIFETLVSYDWPIINYELSDSTAALGGTATSLIYYIGFWLPAAVVGKIAGMDAGYAFQFLWAVLGISLLYYLFCSYKEKIVLWPLAIFVFFSGLDAVGLYFTGARLSESPLSQHLEWWATAYQYSSMTTQLFWVFNQAIPAWLITFLLYIQKNNKSMIIIWSCCMLTSTFPFVGLLPFLGYWIFFRDYQIKGTSRKENIRKYCLALAKDTCTFQNVVGGGIIGIFSFLYLSSNLSGNMVNADINTPSLEGHPVKYITFIIFEVGIFFFLLYKKNKKVPLYYITLFVLLLIPLIRVGSSADFCMRASIPALFLLMIMVIDTLWEGMKDRGIFIALVITLALGSITPTHELVRTVQETITRFNNSEQIYETSASSIDILNWANFSGIIDDNFFYRHIAR